MKKKIFHILSQRMPAKKRKIEQSVSRAEPTGTRTRSQAKRKKMTITDVTVALKDTKAVILESSVGDFMSSSGQQASSVKTPLVQQPGIDATNIILN